MQVDALAVRPRGTTRKDRATVAVSPWTVPVLARIVSTLVDYPVSVDQLRERAMALGLARQPWPGRVGRLSGRAAARLLLAGYRLPAHLDHGGLDQVRKNLLAGRQVFVVLPQADRRPAVFRVRSMEHGPEGPVWLVLACIGSRQPGEMIHWPGDLFSRQWQLTDHGMVVAARSWNDLPREGVPFFGGLRDGSGVYHWFAAGCDTDRRGNILGF
jgi:hypothetical protein